jgi:hypothetical protein
MSEPPMYVTLFEDFHLLYSIAGRTVIVRISPSPHLIFFLSEGDNLLHNLIHFFSPFSSYAGSDVFVKEEEPVEEGDFGFEENQLATEREIEGKEERNGIFV